MDSRGTSQTPVNVFNVLVQQRMPALRAELLEKWWSTDRIINSSRLNEFLVRSFNADFKMFEDRFKRFKPVRPNQVYVEILRHYSREDFEYLKADYFKDYSSWEPPKAKKVFADLPKWMFDANNDVQNQYYDTLDELVIYRRDGGFCVYCGESLRFKKWSLDHVYPSSRFLSNLNPDKELFKNSYLNLVSCCTSCNMIKADFFPQNLDKADRVCYSRKQCIRVIRSEIVRRLGAQKYYCSIFPDLPKRCLLPWVDDTTGARWAESGTYIQTRMTCVQADYR